MYHLAAVLLFATLADTDSTQRTPQQAPARPPCVATEPMPIGGLRAMPRGDSMSVMHVPPRALHTRMPMPTLVVVPCYLADTLAKLDSASRATPLKRPR